MYVRSTRKRSYVLLLAVEEGGGGLMVDLSTSWWLNLVEMAHYIYVSF